MSIDKHAPRKWHKGPPPHVGWWNASVGQSPTCWRWWDGVQWSMAALAGCATLYAVKMAAHPKCGDGVVEWTDYYPDNAVVPRVNPDEVIVVVDEPPTVWVAVGTDTFDDRTAWFYAFASLEDADKFMWMAKVLEPGIGWDAYPCVVGTVGSEYEAFAYAMKEQP